MAGRGVCLWLACTLAAVSGCYSPSVEPCIYACGQGQSCPSGLHCNGQNMCAASATATCGGQTPDAKVDGMTDAMLDAPVDVAIDSFVDLTPPETIIDTFPPVLDGSTSVTFTFHSTEAGSSFECRHETTGTFMSCTSPDMMTGLTNGMHQFEVRARDAAGNLDASPAKYVWTYDDNMPETVLDTHPPTLTNVNNGTFTFHCVKPTDTPECRLDVGGFNACTSATSLTFSGLLDGMHVFTVRCKSPLGMADASPEIFSWTIDSQPPTTVITAKPPNPTNVQMPTFAFTSQMGSTFECQLDGGAFAACTSGMTFNTATDGPHTISIRATDPAGNVETTPATYTWTLDTVAPVTTIGAKPPANSASATATFSWSSEANATFECALDSVAVFMNCTSPQTLTNLAEGPHTVYVRAKDVAGNIENPPTSYTWRVDLTNPNVTFNAPTPTALSITGPAVSFDWTPSETVMTTTCTMDGVSISGCTPSLDLSVPHGANHVFAVTVTDLAGRTGTASVTWHVNCVLTGNPGGGTIGYFHFDEIMGDVLQNGLGAPAQNGFNGGVLGPDPLDVTRTNAGRYPNGRALQFSEARRDTATWPTGIGTRQSQITFEMWVLPTVNGSTTFYALMSTLDKNAVFYQAPPVGTDPLVVWRIRNDQGQVFEITTAMGAGAWNHLIGTYGNGTMRLWVNGGQATPTSVTGNVSIDVGTIFWGSNGTDHLTGLIDEPYISTTAFTTADARQHYCPLTF